MHNTRVRIWMPIVPVLFSLLISTAIAAQEPFPQYADIDTNVSFWIKIYAHYSTTQAVVHDSVNLDIVYAVIALKPAEHPGARKINQRRMRQASQKVERILKRLAANPTTEDADCRRVAALFGSQADARTFGHARHRVRCQIGQRDRFQAGLVRSGAYLDQIRTILKSHGVPADLAYLPHVESSFNTHAYSKFGAAGMWQFTRSTGKRFMTVDDVLDERLDPIAATHAAAQLLKENYDKLGNWPLAITAYNHGAAGMERAKAVHGDYPDIFASYKGRTFKFASRNFYSEFLAARQVASDYPRYFASMVLDSPMRSTSVNLDGFSAFADLCRHFKVSAKVVRAMNPALRSPVFSGQKFIPKGYILNLPIYDEAGGEVLATIDTQLFKTAQKPSRLYTVQRGDTAFKVARMHHVKLDDLILANNLDQRATIFARQTLRIPQYGEADRLGKTVQQPMSKAFMVQAAVVEKADTPSFLLENVPVQTAVLRYRRPGPSPADLLAMVDIESEDAPKDLVDHGFEQKTDLVPADVGFARIIQFKQQPVGLIRVEVEETLGHYAEWAGVSASRIRHLNNLSVGRPLPLHQMIKIPLGDLVAADFEARRYEFHKRMQADFFAAYRIGELQRYRVQPGDSYWTLCREKFDLPLWLLKHYNAGVNLAALKVHQALTIPAIERVLENRPDTVARRTIPEA